LKTIRLEHLTKTKTVSTTTDNLHTTKQPTTVQTTRKITATTQMNEEQRLLELLLNPRPDSKIEFVGNEKKLDDPPELLVFELPSRELVTPAPFVPTFHPISFVDTTPANTTAKCDQPCWPPFPPLWPSPYMTGNQMGQFGGQVPFDQNPPFLGR
jgi:hypothetical protein